MTSSPPQNIQAPTNPQSTGLKGSQARQISYLPVIAAYDRWAQVYDTDSNALQALDDSELGTLLTRFSSLTRRSGIGGRIVDLGCGTGRNTMKLLSTPGADIVGLDLSAQMLSIARTRCQQVFESLIVEERCSSLKFENFDILSFPTIPSDALNANGIISTLVLEHIELSKFFSTARDMLTDDGYLLITNMHPDMGKQTQAGFVDPDTGTKTQTDSHIHTIEGVVEESGRQNFELVDDVIVRKVEKDMVEKLGERAVKWIGVNCWFGMILQKKSGEGPGT